MAQKRRKNAVLVSVLLPVELIREIDARVAHLLTVSKVPVRSRSEWIKRAIRRDLEHDQRSRRSKKRDAAPEARSSPAVGGVPENGPNSQPVPGVWCSIAADAPRPAPKGIGLQPPLPFGTIT